jgi:hypothetical protein
VTPTHLTTSTMEISTERIEECYQRGLEIFHERHVVTQHHDTSDNSENEMKAPLLNHLELYEMSLNKEHPALSEAIDNMVQAFSCLENNDRAQTSLLFRNAHDGAVRCFPDLHAYEWQCLATRIRVLSSIIR